MDAMTTEIANALTPLERKWYKHAAYVRLNGDAVEFSQASLTNVPQLPKNGSKLVAVTARLHGLTEDEAGTVNNMIIDFMSKEWPDKPWGVIVEPDDVKTPEAIAQSA